VISNIDTDVLFGITELLVVLMWVLTWWVLLWCGFIEFVYIFTVWFCISL